MKMKMKMKNQVEETMVSKIIDKILNLRNLGVGWRFGEGGPPDEYNIDLACQVTRYIMSVGATKLSIGPGVSNEIHLEFNFNKIGIELIFEADHTISFVTDTEDGLSEYHEDISDLEKFWDLLDIRLNQSGLNKVCVFSESSTWTKITTEKDSDLGQVLFETLVTEGAFRLFQSIVRMNADRKLSAITSSGTTAASPEIRSHFSYSTPKNQYLPIAI